MNRKSILFQHDRFCCVHISEDDLESIKSFQIANESGGFLARYLKEQAWLDETHNEARTYLVYDNVTDELVAYFSLKAGFVSINERHFMFRSSFDTEPGVELSNFAVNGVYKDNHPNVGRIGMVVFRYFVIPVVKKASEDIGIKIIYIFALPYSSLISYYQSLNFQRLNTLQERIMHARIKPRYDRGCIFMYQML